MPLVLLNPHAQGGRLGRMAGVERQALAGLDGSGMTAAPGASTDDGQLDLLRAEGMGRAGVLALLPRLLRGTHLADRRVTLSPCRAAHLESASPLPLAVDGELLGKAR